MFQIEDVLIPARFICYILQVLLTITIGFAKDDFINSQNYGNEGNNKYKNRFWALLSIFYFLELIEFFILLSGYFIYKSFIFNSNFFPFCYCSCFELVL